MPTKVFFNLKQEKQEKIFDAAVKEFSNYVFEKASIKRIVEDANIARGSFYQYFEDLEDVFTYVIKKSIGTNCDRKKMFTENIEGVDIISFLNNSFKKHLKDSFFKGDLYRQFSIMSKISLSKVGQEIFSKNFGAIPTSDSIIKAIGSLDDSYNIEQDEIQYVLDLLVSAGVQVMKKLLNYEITFDEAIKEIDFKMNTIAYGVKSKK